MIFKEVMCLCLLIMAQLICINGKRKPTNTKIFKKVLDSLTYI